MLSDDDLLLFKSAMQGVTPLRSSFKVNIKKTVIPAEQITLKRLNAVSSNNNYQDGFSDQFVIEVNANDELYFVKEGVQLKQITKLKNGNFNYQASIDLHGFTVEEARNALSNFLDNSIKYNLRIIHVIHGKAFKYGEFATLKSYVNSWLRTHNKVLAFCSCATKHGGTGAVYVLLRRSNKKEDII